MRYLNQISDGGSVETDHTTIYDRMHAYFFKRPSSRYVYLAGLVDVAANDALYYAQNGLSKAAYVRNVWEIFVKIESLNVSKVR